LLGIRCKREVVLRKVNCLEIAKVTPRRNVTRAAMTSSALRDVSIDAVDTRLHRLEYAITGNTLLSKDESPRTTVQGGNIPGQIAALDDRLARVAHQSKHLKRLLHACLPPDLQLIALFHFQLQSVDGIGDTDPTLLAEPTKPPPATDLSHPEKLAIILPSASTYHQTSSLLLALRDTPFPEESVSADIANALPEVVELQLRIAEKEERVRNLAARSLVVLRGWYGIVEGVNQCVSEWDDRLRDAETVVVRRERAVRDAEEF
jgi:hypothetical protein